MGYVSMKFEDISFIGNIFSVVINIGMIWAKQKHYNIEAIFSGDFHDPQYLAKVLVILFK